MNIGDLVIWRDSIGACQAHVEPCYGLVVEHIKSGWVNVYWFADNVPDNPTREPLMNLELLNEGG